MKEVVLKTRKPHTCDYCSLIVDKGVQAVFYCYKSGKFDDNDKQIGIEFVKGYFHWTCYLESMEEQ